MRIVRYELEIVDYQQIQPLWPGTILAVKPGRLPAGYTRPEVAAHFQKIDMWCTDAELPVECTPPTPLPVLGVWIVGTGNPIPDELTESGWARGWSDPDDSIKFKDTCVMANGLVWHVFTSIVSHVHPPDVGYGSVSSVDEIADKVAERRRAELQSVADMERGKPCICEQEAPGIVIWNEKCPRHGGAPHA